MEIEVTSQKTVKETINVEFPYYYEHDLSNDYSSSVIYGKKVLVTICNESHIMEYTIHEKENRDGIKTYEFELDQSYDSCYYKTEHKSNKEKYEAARIRANDFIENF